MKTRVLSALILLPILFFMVLALPTVVTAVVVGIAVSIAAYELLHQTGLVAQSRLVAYSAVSAFLISMWSWAGQSHAWGQLIVLALFAALFGEMMAAHIKLPFEKIAMCFGAGLVVPYLLSGLVRILVMPRLGRFYIIVPLLMAFLPDTGAYFAGRTFGKHKLAPVISPKKTVEGVIGGVLSSIVGMLIYGLILWLAFDLQVNFLYCVIYGIVGGAASVFGDLCFSVIKRQTGIKDYGNLIPGHGGILDRLDSMTVVAPLCEVLLLLIPLAVR